MALRPLRTLSVCSGLGGLDLALDLALGGDVQPVCYVEREVDAAAVLVARMEQKALGDAPIWDDLTDLDGRALVEELGPVDGIIGGIPCQPHSTAGKREGTDDARDLWPHFARLLVETGAWFCFVENVPGLLSSPGPAPLPRTAEHGVGRSSGEPVRGGAFGGILADLDALGFDAEWMVLGAGSVGAPHKRDRLWILGVRRGVSDADCDALRPEQGREQPGRAGAADPGDACRKLGDTKGPREHQVQASDGLALRRRPRQWTGFAAAGNRRDSLADPDQRRSQGQRVGKLLDGQREACGDDADGRGPWPLLWPPGPGEADAWSRVPPEAQPAIRGVAHGPADGVERAARLRALGNGVVPLAGALAFRTLAARFSS